MTTTFKNVKGCPLSFVVPGGRSIDIEKNATVTLTDKELDAITHPSCKWGKELLDGLQVLTPTVAATVGDEGERPTAKPKAK